MRDETCVLDKRERERNFTLCVYSQQQQQQQQLSSTWLELMMASCYFYVLHKTFISVVVGDGETARRHAPLLLSALRRTTIINSIVNGHYLPAKALAVVYLFLLVDARWLHGNNYKAITLWLTHRSHPQVVALILRRRLRRKLLDIFQ